MLVTNELRIIRIEKIGKGCLSYIFCSGDEAMIIDSLYPISYYVDLIKVKKLKITGVVDTHQHADHISAARELAPYY